MGVKKSGKGAPKTRAEKTTNAGENSSSKRLNNAGSKSMARDLQKIICTFLAPVRGVV